ncbi:MAG: hypothetical protein WC683_11990 [bacterium]
MAADQPQRSWLLGQLTDKALKKETDGLPPHEPRIAKLLSESRSDRLRTKYGDVIHHVTHVWIPAGTVSYRKGLVTHLFEWHNRYVNSGVFDVTSSEKTGWRYAIQTSAVRLAEVFAGYAFSDASAEARKTALDRLLNRARLVAHSRFDHIFRPADITHALALIINDGYGFESAKEAVVNFVSGVDSEAVGDLVSRWRDAENSWVGLSNAMQNLDKKGGGRDLERLVGLLRAINQGQDTTLEDVGGLFEEYDRDTRYRGATFSATSDVPLSLGDAYSDPKDYGDWTYFRTSISNLFKGVDIWLGIVGNLADLDAPTILGNGIFFSLDSAKDYKRAFDGIDHTLKVINENRRLLPRLSDSYEDRDIRFLAHELWVRWNLRHGGDTAIDARSFLEWMSVEAQKVVADGGPPQVAVIGQRDAEAISLPSHEEAGLDSKAVWVAGLALFAPSSNSWRSSIQGGSEMLAAILSRSAFEKEGVSTEGMRKKELLSAAREVAIEARDHVVRPMHVKSALAMMTNVTPTDADWEEIEEDSSLPAGIRGALDVWRERDITAPSNEAKKDNVLQSQAETDRLFSATSDIRELLQRLGPDAFANLRKVLADSGADDVSDAEATLLLWELLRRSGMSASEASLVNMDQFPQALAAIRTEASDTFGRYAGSWMRRFRPKNGNR